MLQDKWGETGQPDGFLSQLDSQQLLTWDNLTAPGAFNDMGERPVAASMLGRSDGGMDRYDHG